MLHCMLNWIGFSPRTKIATEKLDGKANPIANPIANLIVNTIANPGKGNCIEKEQWDHHLLCSLLHH